MAEIRYIVRIANKDLNGSIPIYRALTGIKGIGIRMARMIAYQFQKEHNISYNTPLGQLPESMDAQLEAIVLAPQKHGIPAWTTNRSKMHEGKNVHLVMNDLDFAIRNDLQTMKKLKSYKGLRHSLGLTVRGQRTRTSGRKRGSSVGVEKKVEAKPAAPAKAEGKK
ncbi:MAG: 30S ribosomal protein S13 [Candidatus Diapherotrites archaeon]|uniref:30S ribosomal protein S13 n=1 Tax=Candidatus Iainarchaeum sp. TaxID=3101447 RepID=A0A8T4C5K5_9ARCH|nr:30S ribosomal protein S13 [Candidatus Diapherotrites archaeon]